MLVGMAPDVPVVPLAAAPLLPNEVPPPPPPPMMPITPLPLIRSRV